MTGAGGSPSVGPNPDVTTRMICTGTNPIECHFGGAPGNYDVTAVLGGAAAGNTIVQAERFRTMLGPVATAAGQTRRYSFTVNVRQPEGEPVQAVPPGTPGLDVYFLGNGGQPPQLQAIGFAPARAPSMIYVGGDSTVCDQPSLDFGGWVQQLPQFFNFPVSIGRVRRRRHRRHGHGHRRRRGTGAAVDAVIWSSAPSLRPGCYQAQLVQVKSPDQPISTAARRAFCKGLLALAPLSTPGRWTLAPALNAWVAPLSAGRVQTT